MLSRIGIVDGAYCLPGSAQDIKKWGPKVGVSQDRVKRLISNGCKHFHISSDESDSDLVVRAIESLWDKLPFVIDTKDISFIIHARTQPFSIPAPPESLLSHVKRRFGFDPLLDLSLSQLACASVMKAIEISLSMLTSNPEASYALVLTSDRVFGEAEYRLRQDGGIQSDGGGALLLGRKNVKAWIAPPMFRYRSKLHLGPLAPGNAQIIAQTCWKDSRDLILQSIDTYQLGPTDILPINADLSLWQLIIKSLAWNTDRLFAGNIKRRGHACSNDFIINMVDYGFERITENCPILSFGQSNLGTQACMISYPVNQYWEAHFESLA
ncbi:hypothetical protein [Pseudobacteriovorax antillogorgiicola]|uniref:3-oxoacyl-[acyl-carrier-protein] synthase-3 n=1 Tax=Pseudobacteriovorax antillogorgiicola TaxID=1513793 RepID=A0A1Y6C6X9_9BACT|nr:hypothetical protein [Pseudobacteriovorax antillogorgiicola]TCS51199.1 hypothetical protein EDD56_11183 [Pseudobacteriovorax antillogorgiicola]SMF37455.1 hypothetical protein SAMN06296036_11195 [Pseudobacteriovorax antillogorgiicola]